MVNKIDEPIVVAAIFGRKPWLKPVWFIWQNRQYRIHKITYTWMDKEGLARRYHFSVTDGNDLYELYYHTERLTWWLSAIETEG